MTAEGTALNGASEAPKAELAAAKVAVERPAEEREGVGGPFVIVNGDSDGLSDRSGSDKADSPRSDEEDLPPANAAPDADSDHGTAGGELDASDATVGVPSSNGHAPPSAVESEDGVSQGKAEVSDNSEDGLGEQGTAGEELDGEDAPVEVEISHVEAAPVQVEISHVEAGADSAAPVVDSVVNDEELEKETSAAADVAAPEEEQDEATNAAVESSVPDETPTHAEAGSVVLESEGSEEQSKVEQIAAEITELGTDGSGVSGVNGQHDADSCVTATEPEIHVDEANHQESTMTITELVEQDGSNGHAHVESIADSCTSAPEVDADGDEGQQTEALKTEPEVSDVSDSVACKEPIEEEVAANGFGCAEDTADNSADLEPVVDESEGEVGCGVVETEDVVGKDSEEVKPPAKEGINEAIPAETGNTSEQVQVDDEFVKNDVSSGIVHSEQSEPDQVAELVGDQEIQVEVTAGDGNTPVSDVKSFMVEMNTADSVQTQDLRSAIEDRGIPLQEVEEEVKEQASPEDAHLALNDFSSVQSGEHGQLELPGAGVADKSDNVVVEAEPRKEVETEVDDVVPLHVPAASTVDIEPRSIDLDTELESSDSVQARECSSQEISSTTADQVISDVSGEHGTAVTDGAELRYKTDNASLEVPPEAAVDQGEPVALGDNEAVVADEVKTSSATGSESDVVREASDICQTGESRDASTTCEELVSPTEGPCLSDVTLEPEAKAPCTAQEKDMSDEKCKDVENINACSRSSQEVETKCLEVLEPSAVDGVVPVEHKNDDKHAQKGKDKVGENSSESPVDLDKSHKGDIQVIRPQNFFHIVRVPRLASDEVWARVQEAQAHLDRLTQERDALNVRKKKQKAIFDEHREKLEAARKEENEARAAHVDKRNGLDSARSVIGKLNQANSVEEIDELIARKERTMEHETISLKQEKLFIKEINELKAQRKQVCSNLGSEAEISEAFNQKDHIHEQHKNLKKEADLLFKNLKSLEDNRKKIQISFEAERAVLKKLNDELHAANVVRQQAYANWVELRAEPTKKNKYFQMYLKDRDVVTKYQTSRDMDGLHSYCNNQVENFMEMWNKDDDFRRLYIEANKISTLRRLGTHDGRSLGPDEEPPVIPKNNFNRRPNNPSQLTASSPSVAVKASEAAPEKSAAVVVPVEEDSFPVLPPTQTNKQAKSKAAGISPQKEIATAPLSAVEDAKQIEKEKARLLAEELELAKKAKELAQKEEELRQQKAAADKERLVLEQKAKAKEAEERKKKQAQKAQERAEFKARKEAEEKERKRQKKKKTDPAVEDLPTDGVEGNSAPIATADTESNTSQKARDFEVPQQAVLRRNPKLNKLQPMPAPLRNKGKRRSQQYMLTGVAVALAIVAFILAVRFFDLPGSSSLGF